MDIRDIQTKSSIREVLGCILLDPTLLDNHALYIDDFAEPFHQLVYLAISNLYIAGNKKLDAYIIDSYLKENHPPKYPIYQRNNGIKYIELAMEIAEPDNFEANYNELKKFTALRQLYLQGFDITEIFDPDEIDPQIAEQKCHRLEEMDVGDILDVFKTKLDSVSKLAPSPISLYPVLSYPGADVEQEWVVEGILREGTLNSIVGEKKIGKSYLTHQLCFCVQNGIPFLGKQTHKKNVLLLDYEMEPYDLAERFNRLKKFFHLPDAEQYTVSCLAEHPLIKLDSVVQTIQREKKKDPELGLVVLDCYYRFAEGEDENSASETAKTLAKLVSVKSGIAVVYVHHVSKSARNYDILDCAAGSNVHGRIVSETMVLSRQGKSKEKCRIAIDGRYSTEELDVRRVDGFFRVNMPIQAKDAGDQGNQGNQKTDLFAEIKQFIGSEGKSLKTVSNKFGIERKELTNLGFHTGRDNKVTFQGD